MDYEEIAVRGWTGDRATVGGASTSPPPRGLLVVDTETTTDVPQRLTFGSAKLVRITWAKHRDGAYSYRSHEITGEVVFKADELETLDQAGNKILVEHCKRNDLNLITHSEFAEKWLRYYCETRPDAKGNRIADAVLTGFNLPFDLSRMAFGCSPGRGKNKGSFTVHMHPKYVCAKDCQRKHKHSAEPQVNQFRPRIRITAIDSKKSLISWTSSKDKPFKKGRHGEDYGRFLDVRQLVWGMTNVSHSLASACEAFGLPPELCKGSTDSFVITPDFVESNRQDVTATAELAVKAIAEYATNPIDLPAVKVFSPASIAKAYIRKMGITPMLDRPGIPTDPVLLGNCTSSFYGGRSECHIRHVPVPISLLDITSMYPTVNTLMKLWDHLTTDNLTAQDVTDDFRQYAKSFTLETGSRSFTSGQHFTGFVQWNPRGDFSLYELVL